MPVHAGARRIRDFKIARGDAPEFVPADILGGFHLSSSYGVTHSAGTLTNWMHRGNLSPNFVVKGTGLTVDASGDIDFPGSATAFLYEGTPIADYDSHTLFGVYRRDSVNNASGESIIAKYFTSSARRSWQMAHDSLSTWRPHSFGSADGTATTTVAIGPTASGWGYFVLRKSGTDLDTWWNGIASLNLTMPATLFDSNDPICIGGRSGNESTNVTGPFNGAVRDMGYYNSAISDANVTLLLDYLAGRM